MTVIAVDIDGVCANLDGHMLAAINARHGTAYGPEHVTTWDWQTIPDLCEHAAFVWDELYPDDDWHLSIPPIAGALDAVTRLRYRHLPVLVTARTADRSDITLRWLAHHGFPALSIIHTHDKAAACKTLRASVLIEDGPHNALAVAESGTPVLLFDRAYNRHVEHRLVRRVSGWDETMQALAE